MVCLKYRCGLFSDPWRDVKDALTELGQPESQRLTVLVEVEQVHLRHEAPTYVVESRARKRIAFWQMGGSRSAFCKKKQSAFGHFLGQGKQESPVKFVQLSDQATQFA